MSTEGAEKELSGLSKKILLGVAMRYEKESSEYEMVGGVKPSERKRGRRSVVEPVWLPIAEDLLQQHFDLPRLKRIPSGRVARRVGVGRGVASAAEPTSTSAVLRPLLRRGDLL